MESDEENIKKNKYLLDMNPNLGIIIKDILSLVNSSDERTKVIESIEMENISNFIRDFNGANLSIQKSYLNGIISISLHRIMEKIAAVI